MNKPEYKIPVVVTLVYIVAALVAIFALLGAIFSQAGFGAFALLGPAAGIFLVGYALELLSRILYELHRVREQVEGTVVVAPPAREEVPYFLQVDQKSTGPYPLKVLLNRLRMGTLRGDVHVQRIDGGNWVPLETLET